ncbi:hypothetical protein [Beijerinckia sp. L45]|uniref:hypothetical protein n=1 Tax=Beijerinckia sp. L45 TaxID=1641855 RepID=UPI00131AAEC5|nr:hypothetical protein [Beijerinckia sp. L45]
MGAALLLGSWPIAAHADSDKDDRIHKLESLMEAMHKEIHDQQSEIHALRSAVGQTKSEATKTRRLVVERASQPQPVAAVPPLPQGSLPVYLNANRGLQLGGISITPGGFLAAESVFRTKANGGEIATAFGGLPFPNNPLAHTNEFRPSARQSRLALLVEGAVTPSMNLAGYAEFDFTGAAQTANSIQSNSYTPRIRNLYTTLDANDYGLHVLAGQNWSLVTLNSKGITPRNEVLPPTIDSSQMPGSIYARQAQIRVTKDFDKKLWLSLSAEESQTTFAGACTTANTAGGLTPAVVNAGITGVNNIICGAAETGGAFSSLTNESLNHAPDVIGKVAYEARLGERDIHLEALGLYRNLYDRVTYTNGSSANLNTTGYGVGGGLIVPVLPRALDFQINALYGRGIGRYGPSALGETTFSQDGSLKPVEEVIALAGVTLHATPAIDFYAFGGIEKGVRSYFQQGTGAGATFVGNGAPGINDTGCYTVGGTCTGTTKQVYQLTAGMWDKVYKGGFGELRAGLEYTYTNRQIFNTPGLYTPSTYTHAFYTSLRYYPFQ